MNPRNWAWLATAAFALGAFSNISTGVYGRAGWGLAMAAACCPLTWVTMAKVGRPIPLPWRWGVAVALLIAGAAYDFSRTGSAGSGAATAPQAASLSYTQEERDEQASFYMKRIGGVTATCDQSGKRVSEAFSTGNTYRAYELATMAKGICREASASVKSLPLPKFLTGEALTKAEEGRDTLADAYSMKGYAFNGMAQAADGNFKPSFVSDVKTRMEMASAGQIRGIAQLMDALSKGGGDIAKLADD